MTTGGPSNSGSDPRAHVGSKPAGVPEHVIDAFFDRELDPRQSRDLLAGLKHDSGQSEEIARTQRMLSLLKRTPLHGERAEEVMLDAIMARVDRRRRFLPEVWRRFVTAGRLATAATLLLAGLGVAVLGRTHPDLLRLAPQAAPIATLVDSGRTEATEGAARCGVVLETLSKQATGPLRQQLVATVVSASDVVGTVGAPCEPLRPGTLATVRFADSRSDLMAMPGSGEPASGAMGASFALGLELVSSRQRSGASAPVLVPTLGSEQVARSIELRRVAPGSTAVFTPAGGSIACESVKFGDHTVIVPSSLADIRAGGWAGPLLTRRLLFIQASPSDQFPLR